MEKSLQEQLKALNIEFPKKVKKQKQRILSEKQLEKLRKQKERREKAERLYQKVKFLQEFDYFCAKPFPTHQRQITKPWYKSGSGITPKIENKTGKEFWKSASLENAKTKSEKDFRTTEEKILSRRK